MKFFSFSLGLFLLAQAVLGSPVTPFSIAQLKAKSHLVVHGKVLAKSVQRDETGRIYTRVQVTISEVWHGRLQTNQLTVVQSGGILGDQQTVVSGQADYHVGEEVVLFLVMNPRGQGVTISLSQGKFDISELSNGEKAAGNPYHGEQRTSATSQGASREQKLSFKRLRELVKGGAQ